MTKGVSVLASDPNGPANKDDCVAGIRGPVFHILKGERPRVNAVQCGGVKTCRSESSDANEVESGLTSREPFEPGTVSVTPELLDSSQRAGESSSDV